jgi:hypothetical protein
MSGAIQPLPQYAFMAWCLVKKHRDNFTFLQAIIFLWKNYIYCYFVLPSKITKNMADQRKITTRKQIILILICEIKLDLRSSSSQNNHTQAKN